MAPFFSIIIPVYNVAPYLRECLDSVLAQTFADWDVICIDDGSTDGSGAILDEYAVKDKRFRVIHKANGGVSSARNAGLDAAMGEWVWFVDADDAIHPDSLTFLVKLIRADSAAKTISFTTQMEGEQVFGHWDCLPDVSQRISIDYIDSQSLRMHRRGAWATIVRADIAKRFFFRKYAIGEDVLYHMSILWAYPETSLLSAPLYFYRIRSGSAVNGIVSKRKVADLLATECEMLQLYLKYADCRKIGEVQEYYRSNEGFVWYTFAGMFFRLPLVERQELLANWISLQRLQHRILAPKAYKKLVLWVLQIFPSAWLCTVMVCCPYSLKRGFYRFARGLKRLASIQSFIVRK